MRKWEDSVNNKERKSAILRHVNVISMANARIINTQIDELLADSDLMEFLESMCLKNGAQPDIYISFVIRNINAAYNESYPLNLDHEDWEFCKQAEELRSLYGDRRPSLREFFASLKDYLVQYHGDRV